MMFEMVDADYNSVLQAYQAAPVSSGELQTALKWTERGWPLWEAYFPLFERANDQGMVIRGANIPGELMPFVKIYGSLAFPRRKRNEIGLGAEDPFLGDRAVMETLLQQAHGVEKEAIAPFVISQYAKDAYMADQIIETRSRTVLIAGNYHVQKNIGIPVHLVKRAPNASVLSIGIFELSDEYPTANAFFAKVEPAYRDYDFLWFTDTRCLEISGPNKKMWNEMVASKTAEQDWGTRSRS